jgi:hypothetical protein
MLLVDFIQFMNWVALNWSFFELNCPTLIPILLNTRMKRLFCIILCSLVLFHHLVRLNFSFALELHAWILFISIWLSTWCFILFFSLILMVMIVDNRKKRSYITFALIKYKMVVYRKKMKQKVLSQLDRFKLLILLRDRFSLTISIKSSIDFLKRPSFKKCMRLPNWVTPLKL